MKKIKLSVTGMHCASCASNIEKSLRKITGVKNVTISPITNKCFIECDDSVKEEELSRAVYRAGGYKVISAEKV